MGESYIGGGWGENERKGHFDHSWKATHWEGEIIAKWKRACLKTQVLFMWFFWGTKFKIPKVKVKTSQLNHYQNALPIMILQQMGQDIPTFFGTHLVSYPDIHTQHTL